ncbi:transcription factor TGA4-like isoform X2 [Henckelia pumila]|uniref:transcription factor TGA4-like isoform X2 n=1 Tax=Henckelia pumila TaxID=405737 RepID=UPI003C6DEF09
MTTSHSTQFGSLSRMGIYELPIHHGQLSMWDDPTFETSLCSPGTGVCATIIDHPEPKIIDDKSDQYASDDKSLGHSEDNQASNGIPDKIQRRLAQNREAAKKSRLRKKAYVQQLETSRLKLAQLEQELGRARQQAVSINGLLISGAATNMAFCGSVTSGIGAFEMEYGRWIDEQDRKISELRNVMQTRPVGDVDLQILVENVLNHYSNLFRMKRAAARADAFYLVSGTWRTSVERFFLWIGGFRPSELIHVVFPHLEPLDDVQRVNVTNLRDSCSQAEEALTQGMDKLRQTLSQSITFLAVAPASYTNQMGSALEKLESLETFMHQADHLREQSLRQLSRYLTTRQAAKGLVAFAEHFQRLRALSSLWSARPQRPAV